MMFQDVVCVVGCSLTCIYAIRGRLCTADRLCQMPNTTCTCKQATRRELHPDHVEHTTLEHSTRFLWSRRQLCASTTYIVLFCSTGLDQPVVDVIVMYNTYVDQPVVSRP